jgi:hypothetical protein
VWWEEEDGKMVCHECYADPDAPTRIVGIATGEDWDPELAKRAAEEKERRP